MTKEKIIEKFRKKWGGVRFDPLENGIQIKDLTDIDFEAWLSQALGEMYEAGILENNANKIADEVIKANRDESEKAGYEAGVRAGNMPYNEGFIGGMRQAKSETLKQAVEAGEGLKRYYVFPKRLNKKDGFTEKMELREKQKLEVEIHNQAIAEYQEKIKQL